jgi:hypothetical protein
MMDIFEKEKSKIFHQMLYKVHEDEEEQQNIYFLIIIN